MSKTLRVNEEEDYKLIRTIFVIVFFLLAFGPWCGVAALRYLYTDLMVQVKSGLWMLENHQLLLEDVFSWHEGLNWCPHETGWYLLSGVLYKLGGVYALVAAAYLSVLSVCYIFYREVKQSMLISILLACFLFLFNPNGLLLFYNVRPYIISTPLFLLLMTTLWNDTDAKKCGILFILEVPIMAWFHGGMTPLLFILYIIAIVIDLVYKSYKKVKVLCIFLLLGFVLSLCSPIGVETWTYAFMQSQASEIWKDIKEWQPGQLLFKDSIFVCATVLCFMLTNGIRQFKRTAILKAAYLCLFSIMFLKYTRFQLLLWLVLAFTAPGAYDVLWVWLYKQFKVVRGVTQIKCVRNLFTNRKQILSKIMLGTSAVGTLAVVFLCGLMLQMYPHNSLNDVAEKSGRPYVIIEELKSKGYERVFNSYSDGTWLLFNDIKVAQDNRCDLYLKEFSGQDYICMGISAYIKLDNYVEKYKPDAILYSFKGKGSELERIMTEFQPEKYTLVFSYDATEKPLLEVGVESETGGASVEYMNTSDEAVTHWRIYEVNQQYLSD